MWGSQQAELLGEIDTVLRFYVFLAGLREARQVPDSSLSASYRFWLAHYYHKERVELREYINKYFPTLREWLLRDLDRQRRFDNQPFGDWYEAQSASWVNRFVTAPLLYGAEAVVPPTELGLQLRGGLQWGALGQDVDLVAVGLAPLAQQATGAVDKLFRQLKAVDLQRWLVGFQGVDYATPAATGIDETRAVIQPERRNDILRRSLPRVIEELAGNHGFELPGGGTLGGFLLPRHPALLDR